MGGDNMKSALIIYKSKTGFTKKYAEWILEDVICNITTLDKVKKEDIDKHDIIIYGAAVHAGLISGLKKIKKIINFNDKKVIIFATGAAPYSEEIVKPVIDNNLADCKSNVRFFYFESGLCYENMGLFARGLMKTFSKMLNSKKDKTDAEIEMSKSIMTSYDNSKKENIEPLLVVIKEYLNNR
jgi:menaquinone-dependent protoporphyrinogen IX oxidase